MTNATGSRRILGAVRAVDGKGVARIEDRFDTDIEDLWTAITDPVRLARWLGEVEGDLRPGGEFRASFVASGWEGTGRVEACEPPRRVLVVTRDADEPSTTFDHSIEVTLTADGDQVLLAWEERGIPLNLLGEYGAGIQIHVEDLATYLGGAERADAQARWEDLVPSYRDLAKDVG